MASLEFFVKWFITFICLALSIIGGLILVVGVYALLLFKYMPEADAYNLNAVPVVIIIFACVLVVTNVGGSIEKKIWRMMYTVVMAVLATITLILAIYAFASTKYVKVYLSEILTQWFHDDDGQFASIERSYECCGLTGPDSYIESLPLSCCPYLVEDLDPFKCTPIKAFQNGCLDSVSRTFTKSYHDFAKVCIVITTLGLVGSGATLFLLYLRKTR